MDWYKEQKSAAKDIKKNGCAITLRIKSASTYNTTTRRNESLWTEYPTCCIFTIFSKEEIEKEPIEYNDKKIITPVMGVPDLTNIQPESVTFSFNGTVMTVVAIKPIMPGGIPILYKVHLR